MENNKKESNQNKEIRKVIELKETNECDVQIEQYKIDAEVKKDEKRAETELRIEQLKAENLKSMKEAELRYQSKDNLVVNITGTIKTTVVTVGAVTAVGFMTFMNNDSDEEDDY